MRRVGFTLVEVVVVIVVLSVLMTLALPRIVGHERRVFALAVEQVADLLTMFAQREALSARPVGVWYDKPRHALVLVVLEATAGEPQEAAAWQVDRAVAPVKLPAAVDPDRGILAVADGHRVDISQWPIATEPGKPRPRVEITLVSDDGDARTVVLPPYAIAPYHADDGVRLARREPIDLDAAGRIREDW